MIKNGKVKIGKTPSEISGKPCTMIKQGAPLSEGEESEYRDILRDVGSKLEKAETSTDKQEESNE